MKRTFETISVLLQWKEHSPTFYSLMLGRIELAQVSKYTASHHWPYTLKYTNDEERQSYSAETKDEAMQICIDHARKILFRQF